MKQKIQHVSMIVADVEQSLIFYCDILGFKQMRRPEMSFPGAWLALAENQQIHLLELPNPDPVDNRPAYGGRDRHVAFAVDDLDGIKDRLDEAGVAFSISQSGREALFCRDLDGNALEFTT